MEKGLIFIEVRFTSWGKVFVINDVTTIGQPMDKDKIGSIPHFAHQDKLKMDVKKKKSHRSWKKTYVNSFITWEKEIFPWLKIQNQYKLPRLEYIKILKHNFLHGKKDHKVKRQLGKIFLIFVEKISVIHTALPRATLDNSFTVS